MYKAVTPRTLKRIVEKAGYELVAQDARTWIMESHGHPIVISQTMASVPEDIIEALLDPAGIGEELFFKFLSEIEPPQQPSASQQPTAC